MRRQILFHGTSEGRFNWILREGYLDPKRCHPMERRKGVYFTPNYDYARLYAIMKAFEEKQRPVVLVCFIPNDKKPIDDEVYFDERIPIDAIIEVLRPHMTKTTLRDLDLIPHHL